MSRFSSVTLILALALMVELPAGGAEGRILIGFPNTTIASPGHYVVTRDLDGGGQSAIVIEADGVTLDLNGFTLSGNASPDVISIQGSTAGADLGVTIRNGRIAGGFAGIYAEVAASRRIVLEDLTIEGSAENGIFIENADDIVVRNCAIRGTASSGLEAFGSGPFPGRIVDNEISDTQLYGIRVHGLAAGIIENNRLFNNGLSGTSNSAIRISADSGWDSGGNRIASNTIVGYAGTSSALHIDADNEGNLVQENVVRDSQNIGAVIGSNSTLVIGNVVTGSASTGIYLDSDFALAELNQLSGNSNYGLTCISSDAAFRNNMTRGSTPSGVDCASAIDAGGNIP